MKLFSKTKRIIPYLLLLIVILFNFYLYRSEFKVLSDPNDNTFHFALIDEAKNVWGQVFNGKISPTYLLDSWNERWAEGFSLSFYYSHLPEAAISLLSFFVPVSTSVGTGLPNLCVCALSNSSITFKFMAPQWHFLS